MGLAGRVALVTGPARGIGAEAAKRLADQGLRLSLVGLEPDRMRRLAEGLPTDSVRFDVDVRDRDALDRAVAGTLERFGAIDVVVANAGVLELAPLAEMAPEAFERVIDVNLTGVWNTFRACLPAVVQRDGYLLAVASMAVAVQLPLLGAYNASKWGVNGLVNTLRLELAGSGVDVGAAYFGVIDTDMNAQADADPSLDRIRLRDAEPLPPIPVGDAADAIVDAVVRRRRRVVVPWFARPLLWVPDLAQRLMAAGIRRRTHVEELATELRRRSGGS